MLHALSARAWRDSARAEKVLSSPTPSRRSLRLDAELGDDAATWWYTPDGKDPFTTAELEPVDVFEERMQEFRRWLDARPEKSIAVIAHWGVCYSLTGDEFQNCELRTLDFHTDLDVGNGDFQKFDVFLQDNIWGQIGRALVSFKNKLF